MLHRPLAISILFLCSTITLVSIVCLNQNPPPQLVSFGNKLSRHVTSILTELPNVYKSQHDNPPHTLNAPRIRTSTSSSAFSVHSSRAKIDYRSVLRNVPPVDPTFNRTQSILEFFRKVVNITAGGEKIDYYTDKEILSWAYDFFVHEARSTGVPTGTPPPINIQCDHLDYSKALTGKPATKPKYIVDVVAFGFDVDYLELRLTETYDIVDKFIILEQNLNHKGIPKPYFMVPELLKMEQFKPYLEKIEYIQDDFDPKIHEIMNYRIWEVESKMRSKPIEYLRSTLFTGDNAKLDPANVYVIENDGDEMSTRRALAHFKHCENVEPYPIYAPSFTFKKNTAWLLETTNMRQLPLGNETFKELRTTLWAGGPAYWRWSDVDAMGNTGRSGVKEEISPHLGLGAAHHFSDPTHVIRYFIKLMSAPEHRHTSTFPDKLRKIKEGGITMDAIERNLYRCRSPGSLNTLHISQFGPEAQEFIHASLPWALTEKEYRFSWLYTDKIAEHEARLQKKYCG